MLNTQRIFDRRLDLFFSASRERLGDRFDELLDELQISQGGRPSDLPVTELLRLLNALNVSLDSVMNGSVDLETMYLQLSNREAFPKRFGAKLPYSSRFTGFYMLDYVSRNFGEATAGLLRQRLQLRREHFSDLSHKNNILLPLEITSYVHDYFGEGYVEDMGKNSITHYRKTPQGRELAAMGEVPCMLERFFLEFAPTTVEKNYDWSIQRLDGEAVFLEGRPRGEVDDEFGERLVVNRSLELLRSGFFTDLPTLIPGHRGSCLQLKGLSRGDSVDLYRISYAKATGHSELIH
jgi:hypothetical protein